MWMHQGNLLQIISMPIVYLCVFCFVGVSLKNFMLGNSTDC